MHDLRSIARALGGEVQGRQVLAPGPGHSPRDRSLAVKLSPNAPDGFVVYSHVGDDWRACRDYVKQRLGIPAWQPGDEQQRTIPQPHIDKWDFKVVADIEGPRRTEDDFVRIAGAVKIWNEATNPIGTPAENYLRSRALELSPDVAGAVLRFHPRCPWRNEDTGQTDFVACLAAVFRSIDDDVITAIHRIRVDRPERWPKTERRMLGVVHGAAVKLYAAKGGKLAVGEGVETCMAAHQLGITPAWALGSAGAISFFPAIDGVRQLTILAEAGDASSRAIQICGRRWRRAGRRVFISRSGVGSDHNDFLMQQRQR